VAAGAWKWPAGVVPAARRRLSLLPGLSAPEIMAAAGGTQALRGRCGGPRPTIGNGGAG
jgi:hypothetical protein